MKGSPVRVRASALTQMQHFSGRRRASESVNLIGSRTPRAHERSDEGSLSCFNASARIRDPGSDIVGRAAMTARHERVQRSRLRLAGGALVFAVAASTPGLAASAPMSDDLHRPLHLPRLAPGQRCPTSPSHAAPWGTAGQQTLNGRGPAYLIGVGAPGGTISIAGSARDSLGWYGQKTPWAIKRSYEGPILVRGARIGRRGQVRFAHGYGDHLRELQWDAGADQGSPPDPNFRFLASATLFRAPGCYAFQIDGSTFSKIIVVRVRR
jgi:hypothetical protein